MKYEASDKTSYCICGNDGDLKDLYFNNLTGDTFVICLCELCRLELLDVVLQEAVDEGVLIENNI